MTEDGGGFLDDLVFDDEPESDAVEDVGGTETNTDQSDAGSSEESPGDSAEPGDTAEELRQWWAHRFGGRISLSLSVANAFYVAAVFVPRAGLKMPGGFCFPSDRKRRVNMAAVDHWTAAQVKAHCKPDLHDEDLAALVAFEKDLKGRGQRKIAVNALQAELNRRAGIQCESCGQEVPSFASWAEAAAADPYRCQLAAVAYAVGGERPSVLVVGADHSGDESEVLQLLVDRIAAECPSVGGTLVLSGPAEASRLSARGVRKSVSLPAGAYSQTVWLTGQEISNPELYARCDALGLWSDRLDTGELLSTCALIGAARGSRADLIGGAAAARLEAVRALRAVQLQGLF